jgi:hypothetical protein
MTQSRYHAPNRDLSACSGPRAVPPRGLSLSGEGRRFAILAYKDGASAWCAATGRAHTLREVAAAISKLTARSLVLDGEVAIYDQQVRSRFDWLRELDPDAVASPPLFVAAAEGAVTVLTPRGSGGMA